MILEEAEQEVKRLSQLLEKGLDVLRTSAVSEAEKERDYRHGRGQAWLIAPPGTTAAREAWVDAETADLRYERDLAVGVRRAAQESVKSRQTQISAVQSLLSAHKSEANFDRTAPRFDDNRYPIDRYT